MREEVGYRDGLAFKKWKQKNPEATRERIVKKEKEGL